MASAFLLLYYTDVAGISAATAGTLFLAVRVLGGVTDLIAGRRADGTSTRWGRFRPYLLFGSPALLLLLVALFSIPGGLGEAATLAWAATSYALFQLAYSFVNIPYGSLGAAMTQEPDERAKLSSSRVVAASATILLVAAVVSTQISSAEDLQRSLTITTVAFAVIGFALYLWCFATAREAAGQHQPKVSLRASVNMMRHNAPLIVLCVASIFFLTGMFCVQTVGVYYARDVLGGPNLYITLTLVQTVGMIAAAGAIPRAVAALGKKRSFIVAATITSVAAVSVAAAPASAPGLAVAAFGVLGFGLGAVNTLLFALQPDTVDYGEWKSGVRAEGGSYAALSFTRKAGQGVGGAAAAYTIGLGGYVSGAATQTDAALASIRIATGVVPAIVILAAGLVMVTYPLTEQALRGMVAASAQRRALGHPLPSSVGE